MSIPESAPPTRRVGRAMAWGVAIGVGAMVLRELVRPREQAARLIDWKRVEQIALNRCREAADLPQDASREQTYQTIAAELEPLLVEALGPGSLILSFGQKGISRYLGLLLGLLARRVLGQYDPALLGREPVETSSLILVEPNVEAWAEKDRLPIDELRRWLAMHEMTHAWEF